MTQPFGSEFELEEMMNNQANHSALELHNLMNYPHLDIKKPILLNQEFSSTDDDWMKNEEHHTCHRTRSNP